MESSTIYGVAALPWLVELLWLWLWAPIHARRLQKQRELEAVFGPGYFDMTTPQSELYWSVAFGLYHFPLMLAGFAIPSRVRIRHPWLVFVMAMVLTPLVYSGAVLWLAKQET